MAKTDLTNLTIKEALELMEKGKISATELVEETFKQIEGIDPKIKAFLHLFKEEALLQAKESDEKRKKGEKKKNGDKKIENLRKELRKIIDPEVGINIIDMGLVKDIRKTGSDKVEIVFSPTIPTCPIISFFVNEIRKKAEKLGLDCEVKVE